MQYLKILAEYGDAPSPWRGWLIAVAALAIFIGVPTLVIRSRRKTLRNSPDSEAIYAGITGIRPPGPPQPGEVRLIFHTYSGLLVYTIQRTHDLVLPADQAQILLGRMHKHNLTRGLLAYLPFFIVILSSIEYHAQSKKIAAALVRGFPLN
jgi:hypothetical protein